VTDLAQKQKQKQKICSGQGYAHDLDHFLGLFNGKK